MKTIACLMICLTFTGMAVAEHRIVNDTLAAGSYPATQGKDLLTRIGNDIPQLYRIVAALSESMRIDLGKENPAEHLDPHLAAGNELVGAILSVGVSFKIEW